MARNQGGPSVPLLRGAGDGGEVREQLIRIDERERIARDLHDVVVQGLLGVGLHIDRLVSDVSDESLRRQLHEAFHEVEAIAGDLREYICLLRPCVAGSRTLTDALARVAHDVESQSGALVRVALDHELATRMHAHATELVKIAREALSNAARHGKARRCTVALMPVGDVALFSIRDDGHGFNPGTAVAGHGIANMRARAADLGARFDLRSCPGGPTTVSVKWALPLRTARTRNT